MFGIWCRVYAELLHLEWPMMRRNFASIHERVRNCRSVEPVGRRPKDTEILRIVDLACVFYFKEVRCLQRSAVTTRLLRRTGADVEMVIGVQHIPFRAHAWVEMGGRCVNDKPYVPQMYSVIDRF
jgi:hypothetical protein